MPSPRAIADRFARIMPWWCWLLYLGLSPLAVWIMLALRVYHWQIATEWYAARNTLWVVAGGLTLLVMGAAVVAAVRDQGEKIAAGRGGKALLLAIGLLAVGTIGVGIGTNMVSARIDKALAEAEPSVDEFYHNGDKTRLAARVVRMMILKEREGVDDSGVRASLKAIADRVPAGWVDMATRSPGEDEAKARADRALIDGAHEEGLAAFLFDRRLEALDDARWTALIDLWTAEARTVALPEAVRARLVLRLRGTFGVALREALKIACEQGDKAWPAMQIDIAVHLMEAARQGVPANVDGWTLELAALHEDAEAFQRMLMSIDAGASRRHAELLNHFSAVHKELADVKVLAREIKEQGRKTLLIVQEMQAAQPGSRPNGVDPPALGPEMENAIRRLVRSDNPLEKAAGEVARAAYTFKEERWKDADTAIRLCLVWKASRIEWSEKEELAFLLIRGDRRLYDDDPDGAADIYGQAVTLSPNDSTVRLRRATALADRRGDGATEAWKEAADILESLVKAENGETELTATALNNLALVRLAQGDKAQALTSIKRAVEINTRLSREDDPALASRWRNLAVVLADQRDFEGAMMSAQRALAIDVVKFPAGHTALALDYGVIGQILHGNWQPLQACGYFEQAVAIYAKAPERSESDMAALYYGLGITQADSFQPTKGVENLLLALEIRKRLYHKEHRIIGDTYAELAMVEVLARRRADACAHFRAALPILVKGYGKDHLRVRQVRGGFLLAGCLTLPQGASEHNGAAGEPDRGKPAP